MTVKMERVNPPCDDEELRALRANTITPLPIDYVKFLSQQNGGRPEPNRFPINQGTTSGTVTEFFTAAQVAQQRETMAGRIPDDAWPIAQTESGNLLLLIVHQAWSVMFWDHETEKVWPVTTTFSEFLELLSPFSIDDVVLEPDQVVSVWIDPSLLKDS